MRTSGTKLQHLCILLIILGFMACQGAAELPLEKKVISLGGSVSNAPYSPAIVVGKTLYCSGRIGRDPSTGELADGIEAQTKFALESIKSILEQANFKMSDIVKSTVYLTNQQDYAAMNSVYATFFPENPPARATVTVAELVLGAAIEISCIAVKTND